VPGIAGASEPQGVRFARLTDTPPGFQIGLALVTLPGEASRAASLFRDQAIALAASHSP
jgi:hypothetical protein